MVFFFFKQKTAYEWRISDWSSDVCSSDLGPPDALELGERGVDTLVGQDHLRERLGAQHIAVRRPRLRSDIFGKVGHRRARLRRRFVELLLQRREIGKAHV